MTLSARGPPLADAQVPPRPVQAALPVGLGVGGSPGSAARAGRLGLPMMLGLIGGDFPRARPVVEFYRQAAERAGQPADRLRLGITSHFFVGDTSQGSRAEFYPYYREYLRPKTPGGRGWVVGPDDYLRLLGEQLGSGALNGSELRSTAPYSTAPTCGDWVSAGRRRNLRNTYTLQLV